MYRILKCIFLDVLAYVCFLFLFFVFLQLSVDDSLWANGAPWRIQLDVSGLFYFPCKLRLYLYFYFFLLSL
jgi:hypothetical protein